MRRFDNLVVFLLVLSITAGLVLTPRVLRAMIEWERVCTATQGQPPIGPGHPDFCVCTADCLAKGSGTSIACGIHNEEIVEFERNGVVYQVCTCPCFEMPPPGGGGGSGE